MDESTRRRIINAANTKAGRFEEEWAELDLAPTMLRCKADLQDAALIIMNVRPELAINGKLLTRTALAPFACEEVTIRYGERDDRPAGELVVPKFPVEAMSYEEGSSGSDKSAQRHDEEKEDRQPEKPVEQDPDQAGKYDDKVSVGGASRLDFNLLDEDEEGTETLAGTIEAAEDEVFLLEPPSAFMNAAHNLLESRSPGKIDTATKKF